MTSSDLGGRAFGELCMAHVQKFVPNHMALFCQADVLRPAFIDDDATTLKVPLNNLMALSG